MEAEGGTFSVVKLAPGATPVNVGAVGGALPRLTATGTLAVPPGLTAVHVNVATPSVATDCGSQPDADVNGESGSETVHVRPTLPWYQPFAPSGAPGDSVGVTAGGVGS